MTFNTELANRVLAAIEADPAHWNQEEYRCSTGQCFAGWAALMSGWTWVNTTQEYTTLGRWAGDYCWVTKGDQRMHVADAAAWELGMRPDDPIVDRLFRGGNTLGMLEDEISSAHRIMNTLEEELAE